MRLVGVAGLFTGGGTTPVRDAVAAYRNADGGFGHALEPDVRDPASQPAATEMALRIMDETGEVHSPLDFAPEPDSLARELFDEATIKAHLDHLAHAQRDDGGWMFNWLAWSPAAEREWRGFLTVDALRILRANGYPA